ncbi:unnamed protein product [Thlaspi arvense]|uniref:MATH domain-containing protein n=1 Tax=Thlaspi arvense TaxID=13288 RepID=A0AAU9RFC5_THLAR|nr:unnamed protein product [Thlaspi arvense]CAH2039288.1 unnamed protein product [Thlaspi arvense]
MANICQVFCAEASSWGFHHGTKLQHEGFRDKTKLTIQVSIKVLEVVHQGKSTANDVMYFGNFEMIASQRCSVQDFQRAPICHTKPSELTELTETGFKLDWLKSKLEEVSLERKKALSDGSLVQQLEERVKNVELTLCDLRVELDKEKMRSVAR